jgi:hypothetical protein
VESGPPAVCVDRGAAPELELTAERAYAGRYSVALGNDVFPSMASGRCAGPRLDDLSGSLPTAVFRLGRLERGGARVSLAGRFPFRAGPLVGELVSTIALRSRRSRTRRLPSGDGGSGPGRRLVFVDLSYAVERLRGAATADFRAVATPACEAIDACGATGSERYALTAERGRFNVFGFATYRQRRRPTLRQALARIVDHGQLFGYSSLRGSLGETSGTFLRPGGPPCRDVLRPAGRPPLELSHRRGALALTLGFGGPATGDGEDDLFGTRCPGPTHGQIVAGADLATGPLSVAALERRRIHALLAANRHFASGGYSGSRGARFEVDLTRTEAHVGVGGAGSGSGGFVVSHGIQPASFDQRP